MADGQTGFSRAQRSHPGLPVLAARLILGVDFLYASLDKIANPEAFAAVIGALGEVPVLINLVHLSPVEPEKVFPVRRRNAHRRLLHEMRALIHP